MEVSKCINVKTRAVKTLWKHTTINVLPAGDSFLRAILIGGVVLERINNYMLGMVT